jgi:2-polyprenyl-3-methyl-5-hydroxy-6-metoxy-1,4-benzoquinol methylase
VSAAPLPADYAALARQEAEFWGGVTPDPENPQLWDDPLLFDLFLRPGWESLIESAAAHGGRVIDVGCGEGNLSIELARRGMRVQGYDISAQRIERARNKSEILPPASRPEFTVGDFNTICLPPQSADVVVAHDALHHLLALDEVMRQIHGALVPGGALIVYDYIGMGAVRKFLAVLCYALFPTHRSYRAKLGLARRLGRFFASEKQRRFALKHPHAAAQLRGESPFEEISQESVLPAVERYFTIEERREYHAFFFYLAPKLRLPRRWKKPLLSAFARWDALLINRRLCRGAFIFLIARKEEA